MYLKYCEKKVHDRKKNRIVLIVQGKLLSIIISS